jgi:hypothetical protein
MTAACIQAAVIPAYRGLAISESAMAPLNCKAKRGLSPNPARDIVFLLLVLGVMPAGRAGDDVINIKAPENAELVCVYSGDKVRILRFAELKTPTLEAQIAFTDLLQRLQIERNIPAYVGPVSSVAAASAGGKPALIYNPGYLHSLYRKTNSRWAVIAALTHALGHVEGRHADRVAANADAPPTELQADYFVGQSLKRLGASLDDVVAALHAGTDGSDHDQDPVATSQRDQRSRTIKDGYANVDGAGSSATSNPKTGHSTETYSVATIQVPCTHRLPCTHDVPCRHRLPCRHRVVCIHRDKNSPMHKYDSAHEYDLAHPYDPEHPYDSEHTYDREPPAPEGARTSIVNVAPFFMKP